LFLYPNNTHLALVVRKFQLNLQSNFIKNEIFFSNQEKEFFEKKFLLPDEYAVIHSQAKLTYAKNKDWGYKNMQNVINLTPKIKWVQVGLSFEPLLENSIQILNVSLRELAYIVFRSKFVLTLEGLYNHLASCFDKKTFIILSGMLPVAASYYKNNVVISKFEDLDCVPCYRLNSCVKSEKFCTTRITPEYVANMIKKHF
jgi:ADP-heptose:LPS heptosyltransferase